VTPSTTRVLALRMGNPDSPSNPWGRDELDVHRDGRVIYRNQRGPARRAATAQLAAGVVDELLAALAASPFPHAQTGRLPPGSTLIELIGPAGEGEATAQLDYHTALKTPGYDVVIRRLTSWTGVLRTPAARRAGSADLTEIVDQPG
jgi:hypothetical protein